MKFEYKLLAFTGLPFSYASLNRDAQPESNPELNPEPHPELGSKDLSLENYNDHWINNYMHQTDKHKIDGIGYSNVDLSLGDAGYYSTISDIPHLPSFSGYMATTSTLRFFDIREQTLVMIGEPKHGLWRNQENGMVREYLKEGMDGLTAKEVASLKENGMESMSERQKLIIKNSYSSYTKEESWSGYKFPDQEFTKDSKFKNWIDYSIHHPKYEGKYDDHVPIDLPVNYCTMSSGNFPYAENAWKFAIAQKRGNKIGPLGKRAGLDIKENYANAVRLDLFEDAVLWANVGLGQGSDMPGDAHKSPDSAQDVNYKAVDLKNMKYEIYLYEWQFFNVKHLVVGLVIDNKGSIDESTFAYLRPDGEYWEDLLRLSLVDESYPNTLPSFFPEITYKSKNSKNTSQNPKKSKIYSLAVFGHHHLDRYAVGMTGGACPGNGDDWGRYPWANSGGGRATSLQEIVPLCDALALDIKFWANLDKDWDQSKNFATGASNQEDKGGIVEYVSDRNIYGRFDDPYLVANNITNPFEVDLTLNQSGQIVYPNDPKQDPITLKLNFGKKGDFLTYNVPDNVLSENELEKKLFKLKEKNRHLKIMADERIELAELKIQTLVDRLEQNGLDSGFE